MVVCWWVPVLSKDQLFAAAVPAVGVLDMLRFHKFTIGWAWIPEYGDPEVEEDFKFLRAYSPLHNLTEGQRAPTTLVLTADHDDRVVPAIALNILQPFKKLIVVVDQL